MGDTERRQGNGEERGNILDFYDNYCPVMEFSFVLTLKATKHRTEKPNLRKI
jgi:hypothetical protein